MPRFRGPFEHLLGAESFGNEKGGGSRDSVAGNGRHVRWTRYRFEWCGMSLEKFSEEMNEIGISLG